MRTKKYRTIVACIVLGLFLVGGGYCGYRFLQHELSQNKRLAFLESQVTLLREYLKNDNPEIEFISRVSDDGFDYLAIGNSITLHPVTDFWWGEWGMAATDIEHDYYHLVVSGLEDKLSNTVVNSDVMNYYVWETQSHDRTETYDSIDKYLVKGIDLVTIQLSENCSDITTFTDDFKSLIKHIQEKCPKVEIIVIDDFWNSEKHEMKKSVCEEMDIPFVDLLDIYGNQKYMAGMGSTVLGEDGEEHIIEHEGVASHLGNEGMKVIAERVLDVVNVK